MSNEYLEFLKSKQHSVNEYGFKPTYMPDYLFDFQKYIVEYTLVKGRSAIFADTGLGKTAIELVLAENIVRQTNKRVLILTPLAVAYQFLLESEKLGIDDIHHSTRGELQKKIVILNYERLHLVNPNDFICVICDESSILKNEEGVTRNAITSFMKKIPYRFLATATPSPNDFVELGTSSEALGYLGYTDMLGKFFTNNEDTVKPQNIGTKWLLKGHAKTNFFKWVSSWSLSIRKPSDLGFSDEKFILPKLIINYHSVVNSENLIVSDQYTLFKQLARQQHEIRLENKETIQKRCELAVELSKDYKETVYWCNLNPEGDLLEHLDKDAYQIKGKMSIEKKEELLLAFFNNDIHRLITKPKMTGFGLNWQKCNHTTFFPTFSYEQWYQAIRRFYRFKQENDVIADIIYSDGQKRVIDSLLAKSAKANELFDLLNINLNQTFNIDKNLYNKPINLPNFLGK